VLSTYSIQAFHTFPPGTVRYFVPRHTDTLRAVYPFKKAENDLNQLRYSSKALRAA